MNNECHAGGCQCGALRFIACGSPRLVANCHCKDCRKATGAVFATFVDYEKACVTFDQTPAIYQSSKSAERLFCANCGTPVAYRGDDSPDEINIHIGAFDHPELFIPTQESHLESALWKRK